MSLPALDAVASERGYRMQTVYASQPLPHTFCASLYLAGPTPREPTQASWRRDALRLLEAAAYDGVVYVPESLVGPHRVVDDQPLAWEREAMRRADLLLGWVPAVPDTPPTPATWMALGRQMPHGTVVLGVAPGAAPTRDLATLAQTYHLAVYSTLAETVTAALATLGAGAARAGAECLIPLAVWHTPQFQAWYAAQTAAGHALVDVPSIEWIFRAGAERAFPLFIALHAAIRVHGEGRVKANEAVIIRPSIVTVCAYCPGTTRAEDRFLLIKEYRTSVMNPQGFVYEFPGGSSWQPDADPIAVAQEELAQETGLRLARARFQLLERRQSAATMIANEVCLVTVRLAPAEMAALVAQQGAVYGQARETERTTLQILTRHQIMEDHLVDYTTLGQLSLINGP